MPFHLRSALALAIACSFLVAACRNEKKESPTAAGSAVAATVDSVTPATNAPATDSADASVEMAAEDAHDLDAGVDAGRRRRRRVATADAGGGAIDEPRAASAADAEAPAPAAAAPAPTRSGRGGMGDDQPWGGAAASASAVLKKKPLPSDDPWH